MKGLRGVAEPLAHPWRLMIARRFNGDRIQPIIECVETRTDPGTP